MKEGQYGEAMTTSVPQVKSIEDLKWKAAELLQLAVEATRIYGDASYLEMAMKEIRQVYEEFLKVDANLGKLDRGYVEEVRRSIEKIENVIERAKDRAKRNER